MLSSNFQLLGMAMPIAAVLAVTIVLVGVVLPAVWSRKTERRDAARDVLCLLLTRGRQPGSERRRRLNRRRGRA